MTELILLQKVAKLGNLGEIVNTKPGYARNYLIPTGRARRATEANKKYFEERRADFEKIQADNTSKAEGIKVRVNGLMLQLSRKAGVDGRLFGSVTNADIAEAIKAQGIEGVTKSMVLMPMGAIKNVGDSKYTLHIQTDIEAEITVSVLGEQ